LLTSETSEETSKQVLSNTSKIMSLRLGNLEDI